MEKVIELGGPEQLSHALLSGLAFGIEVEAQRASENGGVLGDHSHAPAQVLDSDTFDVDVVDQDLALNDLNHPAKGQTHSALACTRSTDHSDTLACYCLEVEAVEHDFSLGSVLDAYIRELDRTLLGPAWV